MKRIVSMMLAVIMVLSMVPCAVAAGSRDVSYEETLAADLKELGLFKGVSETSFGLGRAPSRIEALVMLVRILGKEQEALSGPWQHPFTDVPQWASPYVGYAYAHGLTKGVSATTFGSGDANAQTYLTFMLRALGYSDTNGADFTWDAPYALATELGILFDLVDLDNFWRADVVLVSYAALPVRLKDSRQTLADKLIDAKVFTRSQYNRCFDPNFIKNANKTQSGQSGTTGNQGLTPQQIAEKCSDAVFSITGYAFNGEIKGYGSGFFINSNGVAVTNRHVVANCSTIDVTLADGTVYQDVKMIDSDTNSDLALLRLDGKGKNFPYLERGDSSKLKQGQRVYAIGSPYGLDNTMSEGIISNTKREFNGIEYVQISVPIAAGSSGGALLDENGKVIGVTAAGFDDAGADLNLAIGIDFVKKLDLNSRKNLVLPEYTTYLNFDRAIDFGAFTGMDLVSQEWIPLGYILAYDANDVHDTPFASASKNYDDALHYYSSSLLSLGFEIRNGRGAFEDWYETEDERVYIDASLDGGNYLYITVEWVPQYYEECHKLPDFGWYMWLSEVTPKQENGSWIWTYEWVEVYDEDNFLFFIELYSKLLEQQGFRFVAEEGNARVYDGYGWSVVVDYDGDYVTVEAAPLR